VKGNLVLPLIIEEQRKERKKERKIDETKNLFRLHRCSERRTGSEREI
jgi:hypothetical protein